MYDAQTQYANKWWYARMITQLLRHSENLEVEIEIWKEYTPVKGSSMYSLVVYTAATTAAVVQRLLQEQGADLYKLGLIFMPFDTSGVMMKRGKRCTFFNGCRSKLTIAGTCFRQWSTGRIK